MKVSELKKEKKIVELFVCAELEFSFDNEFKLNVSTYDLSAMSHCTAMTLDKIEVEVEVPVLTKEFTTLKHVELLKQQYEKEKRDSHLRLESINNKINDLLCLDSK